MESSLSAFLLEGSGHSASLQGPSLIGTLFIRKGGGEVGCSRTCAPLLWLRRLRDDGTEDRGCECAGETPQPLPRRGGEEQLSDLRPLSHPCGHLINASCENIYPGGNGSCFPFLPGGWGEGLHWSCKFQQRSALSTSPPWVPRGSETEVSDTEKRCDRRQYTAGRSSLQEHIHVHLLLLFSSFSSISFKLSCHLSLFDPGSPEGTLTFSPAWQVMQWVDLGHSRSEILRAEVSTGLEKPFVSLKSGCPGSLSVVLLSL